MSVAGAYWRGDEAQPHAAAHLRHGLAQQEGAEGVPPHAGRGQEARPPQAGPGTGNLHLRRGGRPGSAALAAQRRGHHRGAGEAGQGDGDGSRLSTGAHAPPDQGRSLHPQRPSALLRREHVPAHGAGGRELLCQADELPHAPQDLRQQAAQLPRSAGAPGRVRHLLPLREERRALRPDARALHADERRPHLLLGRAV